MHKRTLMAALATLPLAACGFRLRGVPQSSFASLYVQAPPASPLARELRRTLAGAGGAVTVLSQPAELPQAETVLELLGEQQERVVVG